jgi:hypothetical protein
MRSRGRDGEGVRMLSLGGNACGLPLRQEVEVSRLSILFISACDWPGVADRGPCSLWLPWLTANSRCPQSKCYYAFPLYISIIALLTSFSFSKWCCMFSQVNTPETAKLVAPSTCGINSGHD